MKSLPEAVGQKIEVTVDDRHALASIDGPAGALAGDDLPSVYVRVRAIIRAIIRKMSDERYTLVEYVRQTMS